MPATTNATRGRALPDRLSEIAGDPLHRAVAAAHQGRPTGLQIWQDNFSTRDSTKDAWLTAALVAPYGLRLYDNDNRFVKLVHSVLPLNNGGGAVLHQTEFTKEDTRISTGQVSAVPMFGGPATPTLWLRMFYRGDVVRMAPSTDGFTWEWGGSWSLPRRPGTKIGLVSMNTAGATGSFDHVRTHQPWNVSAP